MDTHEKLNVNALHVRYPEEVAFNDGFEQFGNESVLVTVNIATMIWIFCIYAVIFALMRIVEYINSRSCKVACCSNRLSKYLKF